MFGQVSKECPKWLITCYRTVGYIKYCQNQECHKTAIISCHIGTYSLGQYCHNSVLNCRFHMPYLTTALVGDIPVKCKTVQTTITPLHGVTI